MILDGYKLYKLRITDMFKRVPGKVSTLGTWMSKQQVSYLVVSFWISAEHKVMRAVLDFTGSSASHTDENLKNALVPVLRKFGCADRVLGSTADGGSNVRTCYGIIQPEVRATRILSSKGSHRR